MLHLLALPLAAWVHASPGVCGRGWSSSHRTRHHPRSCTTSASPRLELSVSVRAVAGKGEGAFAAEAVPEGRWVCSYVGELISLDDVDVRYPDDLPRYLFDVGGGFYLDAQDSAHFSRYFNHDEHGSLRFVVDKTKRTIDFFAARPIAHGDELTFDYGPGYWIGLELKPATGTDTRDFTLKKEEAEVRSGGERRCGKKQMPTPITIAELEALSALGDDHERRLALLRCLVIPQPPEEAVVARHVQTEEQKCDEDVYEQRHHAVPQLRVVDVPAHIAHQVLAI